MADETPNPQIPKDQVIFAWGYPDTYSVFPGETLRLHVTSQKKSARVRIYSITQFKLDDNWDGAPQIDLGRIDIDDDFVSPKRNDTDLGVDDWLWPQNVNVPIPGGMESGIYIVEIVATAGQSDQVNGKPNWVMFVVKNPNPNAPILYKFCINTVHAYNLATHPYFGIPPGKDFATYNNNFYENPASNNPNPNIMQVTMRRPATRYSWSTKSILNDYPLVLWMQKQGYKADFCTDVDVHLDTDLAMLSRYSHLVSPGHDEYWSRGMYDNLTAFRNRGGNISFLSGNTCCWEVHMGDVDNGIPTSFFTDKGPQRCDVNGPDAWFKVEGGPENRLIGVGTRHSGIRGGNTNPFDAQVPASPGYRVQNTGHWVLANTGLPEGHVIGVADLHTKTGAPIVENFIGYEGGGVHMTLNGDGSATPLYDDGTPRNFVVLGVAPTMPAVGACARTATDWAVFSRESQVTPDNDPYAAIMGIYSAYGSVFSGSTVYWGITVNSFDADAGFWRDVPKEWAGGVPIVDGHPVLGNPHLHRIMRNLFDNFQKRERSVVTVADINGNGLADLVLQHDSTGEPSYWLMESIERVAAGSILDAQGSKGPNLRIVGVGNFTSPESRDLLWQDQTDGHLEMSTLTMEGDGSISTGARTRFDPDFADPAFRVAAILDLNRDGRADILFQNQNDGSLFFWVVIDGVPTERAPLEGETPGRLVAAADLTADGQEDLIFQKNDGSLELWERDGITFPNKTALPAGPGDPEWRVVGAGDFTQDQTRLIVFQHAPSGDLHFAAVAGLVEEASGAFEPSSNPRFL